MSAACRYAAKSFPAPAISKSKCSMPIRDGSSACASPRARNVPRPGRRARAAAARQLRSLVRRRPTTMRARRPAMAPVNAWPVLLLTFPVMVWLIDGAGAGRLHGVPAAAMAGWWFGLGYFVPGLYWIGYAFLVDASTFAWLMPFAVLGLPAYLALFNAFGFALARLIWTRDASRVIALAGSLTIGEWLRGHVLTGFPWNAFGYALSEPLALAQTASLIGLWGLTFLSVAIFASPAVLIDGTSRGRKPWIVPVSAMAMLVAMGIFGGVRLALQPTAVVAKVRLRIMQPDLQQDARFNYSAKA